MPDPDYKALCAELIQQLQELHTMVWGEAPHLLDEDRGGSAYLDLNIEDVLEKARAALAQPEPVSERWPEFSDCNPFEAVWAFNPVLDHWKLTRINQTIHTHWLPHWALPMPAIAAEALPND